MHGTTRRANLPELSVIIPVYNEIETLPRILARVRALPVEKEIILIDNVSTDGTRELVAGLEGEAGLRAVLQEANQGKGGSVRRGIGLARGEWLVIQDADEEYRPEEIPDLLAAARREGGAVFGSRLLRGAPRVPWHHALGRDGLNLLFRLLYGARITDVATCYKLMPTALAQRLVLESSGFDLDYEIACKLRRAGASIIELPVSYTPRTLAEGKKLRWTDGLRALEALVRYRFARRVTID